MIILSMLNASFNRFNRQRQFLRDGTGSRCILLRIKDYTNVPLIETPEFHKISTKSAGNCFNSYCTESYNPTTYVESFF